MWHGILSHSSWRIRGGWAQGEVWRLSGTLGLDDGEERFGFEHEYQPRILYAP